MKKLGTLGVIGIIAVIAAIVWLFVWLYKNGKLGGNGSSAGTGRSGATPTNTNNIFYPVIVPVNPPKPHEDCKPKQPNVACVPSYSTPDGKTWVLDANKSTGDKCCYYATSAAPTPAI